MSNTAKNDSLQGVQTVECDRGARENLALTPKVISYMISIMLRVVLDTDVIVAALRSPRGASAAILRAATAGQVRLLSSVALVLEYEAKCTLPLHYEAAELSHTDALIFVDTVAALSEPVELHFFWRPQLRDPSDEMVLETAINGGADAIVTFNLRDYGQAPRRFGLDLLLPSQAIQRIRS